MSIAAGKKEQKREEGLGSGPLLLWARHQGIYVFSQTENVAWNIVPPRFSAPGGVRGGSCSGLVGGICRSRKDALAPWFLCGKGIRQAKNFGNGVNDGSIRLKSDAAGGLGERCNPMQDSLILFFPGGGAKKKETLQSWVNKRCERGGGAVMEGQDGCWASFTSWRRKKG